METNDKEVSKAPKPTREVNYKGKQYAEAGGASKDIGDKEAKPKKKPVKKEPQAVVKKTLGEKIAENFLVTDKEEIEDRVIYDYIIPGIKNLIEDIIHMILFGGSSNSRIIRERGETRPRRVRYEDKFDERRRRDDEFVSYRPSRKPIITFSKESLANQVLSGLCEYVDDYGRVTLKEFYSIVSEVTEGDIDVPTSWTMTKYGWYDMTGANITHTRSGWCLKMPKAEVLSE